MGLDAADLDDLDRAILDYFRRGEGDGPWGIATPTLVRRTLDRDGVDVPTRQTINNRLRKFEYAGHLENRYGTGVYVFQSDPREE